MKIKISKMALSGFVVLSMLLDLLFNIDRSMLLYGIIALFLVNVFDVMFRMALRTELDFPILLADLIFIVIGTYAGNRFDLYHRFFFYDMILHFISGCLIVMTFYDVFFPPEIRAKLPISLCLLLIFLSGIAGAAIWEIAEFTLDVISGLDVQRNLLSEWELLGRSWQNPGLKDTMNDIILGSAGSGLGTAVLAFRGKRRS